MRIINERYQVRVVAERWRAQYFRNGAWSTTIKGDAGVIYERLVALNPETATARDVAQIIGNDCWAGPSACHECGEVVDRTVEIGQPPDYESRTAEICESCIRKALSLFEQR